jgi:hypothetical protein
MVRIRQPYARLSLRQASRGCVDSGWLVAERCPGSEKQFANRSGNSGGGDVFANGGSEGLQPLPWRPPTGR